MKNFLLITIVLNLIISSRVYCQCTTEWVAFHDSTSAINFNQWQMKVTPAGNVYVSGSTWDSAAFYNILIKYDTYGNVIWSRTYDSLSTIVGEMAIDADENIYLTGRYIHRLTNVYYQYLTLKYDSSGGLQWATPYFYPGNGTNYPYAIAVDDSQNVYVTGESVFDMATVKYNSLGVEQWVTREDSVYRVRDLLVDSMHNTYITGTSWDTSGYNLMIIKYDLDGNLVWNRKFNELANPYAIGNFIRMDVAGDLIVGGHTSVGSNERIKILKYSANGNLKWISEYDSTIYGEGAYDMKLDQDGNIYITGVLYDGSGNSENYLTVKFDSSGQVLWAKVFDGGNLDDASSLEIDASGNVFVTGRSQSLGYQGFVTIKYDNNGNEMWLCSYGYSNPSWRPGIGLDALGNIYVCGDLAQQTAPYKHNLVTLKYGFTTGIPTLQSPTSSFQISPNPAFQYTVINWQSPIKEEIEIVITDMLGKILFRKTVKSPISNFQLQTFSYPSGIYFVKAGNSVGKFIKQ